MLTDKEIRKYDKYKKYVPRSFLLHIANELKITHADKVIVVNNHIFMNKSGNNKRPKIINIDELLPGLSNRDKVRAAKRLAIELYTDDMTKVTEVYNKDTDSIYEIGKSGIKKTYSGMYDDNKINTFNKLKEIGEEGIYILTTRNVNNEFVLYHHFITPVKALDGSGNAFVRSVVREFLDRKNLNNKFYYHEFIYLTK